MSVPVDRETVLLFISCVSYVHRRSGRGVPAVQRHHGSVLITPNQIHLHLGKDKQFFTCEPGA